MVLRLVLGIAALILAAGGFLGQGPTPAGPFNPFGWLFVGIAVFLWLGWNSIKAGFEQPGLLDGITRTLLVTGKRDASSGGSSS